MADLPEKNDDAENPDEGYALAPSSTSTPTNEYSPPAKVFTPSETPIQSRKDLVHKPRRKAPFQFSIADMFVLTTAVAVFMSVMSMIPSGFTSNTVAGVAGVGAFLSLILMIFWPHDQPLLRLGWRVMFVLYLLACIGAVIYGR